VHDPDDAPPESRDDRSDWRSSGREVWFLNRNMALLRARRPVQTWLTRAWPDGPELTLRALRGRPAALLIPPFEDLDDAWDWCQDNAGAFVQVALQNWFVPPELWPAGADWDMVERWFDIELVECLWDLVDEELSSDPEGSVGILDELDDEDFAEA
jgi:hypothetical protein